MKTVTKNQPPFAAIEQVTNNTTSWLGHRMRDNEEVMAGQTFVAPSEGNLEAIEVFSSIVTKPGKVTMTLHQFDPQQKSWGPAMGSASVDITNNTAGNWLAFNIPGLRLDKGKAYGFQLGSSDTYMGLGEAAGSYQKPPFGAGQEWQFTKKDKSGNSFSYFSLAFKVGLRA